MTRAADAGPPHFEVSIVVDVPAARVLQAFVDHDDLAYWWEVERSVAVARATGAYAVDVASQRTPATTCSGRLGGTLHGTVID